MNMFTGVLEESGGVATSISRIGIYDSTTDKTTVAGNGNGLFFELNGTTLSVVKRLKDVDTGVPQASWNYDTFDGTGPSGLTITDWSKAYLFVIDLQYLGVGRARFGFYYNGVIRYCHYFNHSGGADAITAPYIKTAKLPIRYEIVSSAGVNAKMRMMCATVHSEGGYLPQGRTFAIGRQTAASISGANYIPLIAIRLVKTEPNNRATGIVQQINVMNTSAGTMQWFVYECDDDSILTSASFVNANGYSHTQYDISATAFDETSSKVHIHSCGYTENKAAMIYDYSAFKNSPLLCSNIVGEPCCIVVAGYNITGSVSAVASIQWNEIT